MRGPHFCGIIFEETLGCNPINTMNSRKIIKLLKKEGWAHVRTSGDHWHFHHPARAGIVTVPHPKKDIPVGTLKSIERQAGITLK